MTIASAAGDETTSDPFFAAKTPVNSPVVGAKVTVTEIYEGANYKLDKEFDAEQTVTLAANEIAQVEFKNTYDDTYHGGGSVKNEFTKTTTDKGNGVYDPTAKIKDKDQLEADKAAK